MHAGEPRGLNELTGKKRHEPNVSDTPIEGGDLYPLDAFGRYPTLCSFERDCYFGSEIPPAPGLNA